MKTKILAVTMFFIATFAYGADWLPKLGTNFISARHQLLAEGWQPTNTHSIDSWEYVGVEKQFVERGFWEISSCSADKSLCAMYYHKPDDCLKIIVEGEEIEKMKITLVAHECPSK